MDRPLGGRRLEFFIMTRQQEQQQPQHGDQKLAPVLDINMVRAAKSQTTPGLLDQRPRTAGSVHPRSFSRPWTAIEGGGSTPASNSLSSLQQQMPSQDIQLRPRILQRQQQRSRQQRHEQQEQQDQQQQEPMPYREGSKVFLFPTPSPNEHQRPRSATFTAPSSPIGPSSEIPAHQQQQLPALPISPRIGIALGSPSQAHFVAPSSRDEGMKPPNRPAPSPPVDTNDGGNGRTQGRRPSTADGVKDVFTRRQHYQHHDQQHQHQQHHHQQSQGKRSTWRAFRKIFNSRTTNKTDAAPIATEVEAAAPVPLLTMSRPPLHRSTFTGLGNDMALEPPARYEERSAARASAEIRNVLRNRGATKSTPNLLATVDGGAAASVGLGRDGVRGADGTVDRARLGKRKSKKSSSAAAYITAGVAVNSSRVDTFDVSTMPAQTSVIAEDKRKDSGFDRRDCERRDNMLVHPHATSIPVFEKPSSMPPPTTSTNLPSFSSSDATIPHLDLAIPNASLGRYSTFFDNAAGFSRAMEETQAPAPAAVPAPVSAPAPAPVEMSSAPFSSSTSSSSASSSADQSLPPPPPQRKSLLERRQTKLSQKTQQPPKTLDPVLEDKSPTLPLRPGMPQRSATSPHLTTKSVPPLYLRLDAAKATPRTKRRAVATRSTAAAADGTRESRVEEVVSRRDCCNYVDQERGRPRMRRADTAPAGTVSPRKVGFGGRIVGEEEQDGIEAVILEEALPLSPRIVLTPAAATGRSFATVATDGSFAKDQVAAELEQERLARLGDNGSIGDGVGIDRNFGDAPKKAEPDNAVDKTEDTMATAEGADRNKSSKKIRRTSSYTLWLTTTTPTLPNHNNTHNNPSTPSASSFTSSTSAADVFKISPSLLTPSLMSPPLLSPVYLGTFPNNGQQGLASDVSAPHGAEDNEDRRIPATEEKRQVHVSVARQVTVGKVLRRKVRERLSPLKPKVVVLGRGSPAVS